MSRSESDSSDYNISLDSLDQSQWDPSDNIKIINNDNLSKLTSKNISDQKWPFSKRSTKPSSVYSDVFYTEIFSIKNPVSNPTPSVFWMLTEDQKLK